MGRNAWLAEDKPEYHFWTALWTLTQFEAIPRDTLRSMADDPYLREHPEVVEGIMQGFLKSQYMNGTYVRKDTKIREMEEQQKQLDGSRLIRWARRLRDAKSSWIGGTGLNGNGSHKTPHAETVGS